ncbi:DEAD/DEAH box helicase family protein [Nonlabens sp.]|uniref:DEAD/DEAH box helicase n=1 Tax=Nonlabens sp. TaxID=1888209 RepID=UPI00326622CC
MGLNHLIKNLSDRDKSKILGDKTTKIIRYSFVNNDNEALPREILNKAVALHNGINLVNKTKLRTKLIESIPPNELKDLGFEGTEYTIYDHAIETYNNNLEQFFKDFKIENTYREIEVEDNRTNFEYAIPIYGEPNGTNAFPHSYQLRVKKNLSKHLNAIYNYNTNKTLVTLPTGAGKTVLAMETIVDLIRNYNEKKPLNIAWVVNSKELCEQSLQSFQKIWKQKGDRLVMAQRYWDRFNSFNKDNIDKITFASFQLLTPRVINNSPEDLNFIKNLDYLFIDEAHFTGADQYQEIFKTYIKLNDNPKIVGLTATPLRADDSEFGTLKTMFNHYLQLVDENNNSVPSPIDFLIERDYLSNIEYQVINELSATRNSQLIDKSAYYKGLHENVVLTCRNLIEDKKNTIIFAESKAHAIALSLYLKSEEIENELIVGETPTANRKKYLERLGNKEDSLSILVNEKILATGIDVPGLNSIMILANIDSITTALQILGRAMRGPKNGGNKNNTIYITKDNKIKLENYNLLEAKALNN